MESKARIIVLIAAMACSADFARAEEKPAAEPKPWSFTLGLSYLGTTGNTRSQTVGADFSFKRLPAPWGVEGGAGYVRGDLDGDKAVERVRAGIKGSRQLATRWDLFLSGAWERDRFAGYDGRLAFAGGAAYKAIAKPNDELVFDLGLSWNRDETVLGASDSYLGGLLQARYQHTWTSASKFQQKLLFVPNFASSARWRGESETALITALTGKLAFKGSFLVRYNHVPPPFFRKTDTTSALSLVYSF